MTTPEGRVKSKIKLVLETYKPHGIYYTMRVPVGFGRSTLDYVGFLYGRGFAIEAKAPGKRPTDRQEGIIDDIRRSHTPVFVIDGVSGLAEFNDWCQDIVREQAP